AATGAVAASLLAVMSLLVLTPLLRWYLFDLQDAAQPVAELAWWGLALCLPLPALAVLVSGLQGLLIHAEKTRAVNAATALQLLVLGCILTVGLLAGWPGLTTAVIALQISTVAQGAFMALSLRRAGASAAL
ncbi:MAG: hypothetical protein AAF725_24750, partial [Acidobacteriota bacterium]